MKLCGSILVSLAAAGAIALISPLMGLLCAVAFVGIDLLLYGSGA